MCEDNFGEFFRITVCPECSGSFQKWLWSTTFLFSGFVCFYLCVIYKYILRCLRAWQSFLANPVMFVCYLQLFVKLNANEPSFSGAMFYFYFHIFFFLSFFKAGDV